MSDKQIVLECKLVSGHIQHDGSELDNLPDQDMVLVSKDHWSVTVLFNTRMKELLIYNSRHGVYARPKENKNDRAIHPRVNKDWIKDRVSKIGESVRKRIKDDTNTDE